ncbi:uncharacterized protein LOC143222077 isoform X2 [Tachypleus tridentatus]|uniref:uncharacterized protein LOC143222077 isoform X2 n=1 Tax=Tachypleus tridentatus TaxID=6853 RepID=UPI003FD69AAE
MALEKRSFKKEKELLVVFDGQVKGFALDIKDVQGDRPLRFSNLCYARNRIHHRGFLDDVAASVILIPVRVLITISVAPYTYNTYKFINNGDFVCNTVCKEQVKAEASVGHASPGGYGAQLVV